MVNFHLDIAGKLSRFCIHLGVAATVLYFQIQHWPKQTDTYYTNFSIDNIRGGVGYTCGCSLPASLQAPKNTDANNVSLNICYESSSLETVTVLMYSESAAVLVPDLEPVIIDLASYGITYRTLEGVDGGHRISQEAHDLSGYIQDHVNSSIPDLFPNGYRRKEIHPTIEDLQGPNFMIFPRPYVRLSLTFNCNDWNICGLGRVNEIANNVVINGSNKDAAWANCFSWGECSENNISRCYQGRCLFYPTEALPANFAIQKFFDTFMELLGVTILDSTKMVKTSGKSGILQPSALYMNVSQVDNYNNTNPIRFGFVEVVRGSAFWASLLNLFPTLGDCAAMHNMTVCNGTSVCNVFTNGDNYDLRCHDMNDQKQCIDWMGVEGNTTLDNVPNVYRPAGWLGLECPPFECYTAPPYSLMWNTSEAVKNDSLNQFLSSRILNNYWGQHSGVCTKTYENVLRFPSATPEALSGKPQQRGTKLNDSDYIFLQSECANPSKLSTYCWLTGLYRNINDTRTEEWKNVSDHDEDLFRAPDRRFVCYRVNEEGFIPWFITTVGVLFGWTGTVDLLLRWFVIPLFHKFHNFVHARKVARMQRKIAAAE